MSVEGAAVLILIALAAGIVVGQRVRLGQARARVPRPTAPDPAAGMADTYAIGVGKQIAAGCGCS
jgi:hypothetical protein